MSTDGRRYVFIREQLELWSGEVMKGINGKFVVEHAVYLLRYRVWQDEFGRLVFEQLPQAEEQKDIIARLFDQVIEGEAMLSELLAA